MSMIAILSTVSVRVPVDSLLYSGIVYASRCRNDKCFTGFEKDRYAFTTCFEDKEVTDTIQHRCKCCEFGEQPKCSSSQYGQGVFSNNPDKEDNGGGIFEKFEHIPFSEIHDQL
jgi:hypothetical protein